jgi:hypothetical protein
LRAFDRPILPGPNLKYGPAISRPRVAGSEHVAISYSSTWQREQCQYGHVSVNGMCHVSVGKVCCPKIGTCQNTTGPLALLLFVHEWRYYWITCPYSFVDVARFNWLGCRHQTDTCLLPNAPRYPCHGDDGIKLGNKA